MPTPRATFAALVVALSLAVFAAAEGTPQEIDVEDGVLVLTDDNFQTALDLYGPLLVEFYAPWCGHCKSLAPIYVETAEKLLQEDPPIRIAKIDATEHREASSAFGVRGFPTVKLVRSRSDPDSAKDYSGPRGAGPISTWVLDNIGSRASPAASAEDVAAVVDANRVVLAAAIADAGAAADFRASATGIAKVAAVYAAPEHFAQYGSFAEGDVFVLKTVDGETTATAFTGNVADRATVQSFTSSFVDKYAPEQGVLVLTDDNFDDAIDEFGTLLVEFYAPWCGHCKKLAPEYAEAAKALEADGDGLKIAKVDATEWVDLRKGFDVASYPTLLFVCGSRSSFTKYTGARTANGVANYVRVNSFAPTTILADSADATAFMSSGEVVVIGAFESPASPEAIEFRKATACIRGITVGITYDSDVAQTIGASVPGISVFKQYKSKRADYEGPDFSRTAMTTFVQKESTKFPEEDGVLVLTQDTFEDAMQEYGSILLEFYAPWCGHCKALAPEYAVAAQKLAARDQPIRIAKIDATSETELAAQFGVKGYPTLKLHRNLASPEAALQYTGGRTASAIEKWMVKKIGSVPTYIKSADEASTFVSESSLVVLAFLHDVNSPEAVAFRRATAGLPRAGSAYTDNAEVVASLGGSMGSVVLMKTGEDGAIMETFEGDATDSDAIHTFVSGFIDPIPIEAGVLVIEEDNYELATATYPTLLLEFYAPWCGHCKQLAPKYAEAAATLRDGSPSFRIAKVDATENPALAKQFEVKSYPTLKFLCQGAVSDYTGARTADSIVTWVREHSTADLTVVESLKDMEALASSSVVTLMAYVGGLNDLDAQAFSKSVVCSKGFALGITTNADVAAKYGVEEAPAMWAVNSFRTAPLVFKGELSDAAAVASFIDRGTKKFAEDNGVLVLDEENFDNAVEEYGTVLAEFYAPWCGHCKKLAPEYVKAAAALLEDENPIRIAKIDATHATNLAKRFEVGAYPTLKLVRANGEVIDFDGGRTGDAIITWMRKKIGSRPIELATADAVSAALSASTFVVLGFFADARDPRLDAFKRGATGLRNAGAGYVTDAAVFSKFGVTGDAAVVVFKTTDDGPQRHTFEGDARSDSEINAFLRGLQEKYVSDGGVLALETDNFDDALEEFGGMLVEFYAPWCGHCKQLAPKYAAAAVELMQNDPPLRIAKVDATAETAVAGRFDVAGYPSLLFVCGSRVVKYDGQRETADIVKFVKEHSYRQAEEVASIADIRKHDSLEAFGVAVFKSLDGSDAKAFLKAMACSSEHIFVSTSREVAQYLGVRAPGLAVVQNFGSKPKVVKFQGDVSDTAAVEAFLDEASRKFPEDESVLVLNDKNFNAAIDEYGSVLVEFYAPWCGHCKKLAPEYAKAAAELKADGIRIAKVDATASPGLKTRFGVSGFPTIKLVRANGEEPKAFGGTRTQDGISKWVRKNIGSRPVQITSQEGVTQLLGSGEDVVVAGVFESLQGDDVKAFKIAASGLPRVAAGYVVGDTELATALGATTGDIVVMKTTVDDAIRETFSGNAASKMDVRSFITSFVDKYAYDDGVLVLEDDNFSDAVREWGSMLVEFYAPWCGHCKQLAPKYVEAARQLKEFDPSLAIAKVDATEHKVAAGEFDVTSFPTLKFVCGNVRRDYAGGRETKDIVDFVKENSYASVTSLAGQPDADAFVASADVVAIAIVDDEDGADALAFRKATACSHTVKKAVTTSAAVAGKYGVRAPSLVMVRNFREGTMGETRVFHGELTDLPAVADFVHQQSRRFPEEDGVLVLTGANFDAAVKEYGALMVEFYAPWCGHCKKLAPEYSKAARTLASEEPPFMLAKVDAAANGPLAKRFGVSGYPTVKMVRAYGDAVPFTGQRTSSGIVDWVHKLSGSTAQLVNNAAEAAAVKAAGYLVAFGAFHDVTSAAARAFRSAAAGHKHYVVAYAQDAGALEEMKATADSIVVYHNSAQHTFSGNLEDIQAIGKFLDGFIEKYMEHNGVLILDGDNFDHAVQDFGPLLVKFYAPWCKACKQMESQYQDAGKELAVDGLRVAQLDADAYDSFKKRYGVEEFPTLKLMCGGGAPEFTGDEMNTTEIVSWVREKALAETPVLALDALKAAVAEAGTAVIGFFDDLESVAAQGFRRGTACMEQVPAFISSDPQAFAEYGVQSPSVVLIKKWGTKRDDFSGSFTIPSSITEFVTDNAFEFPEEDGVLVLDDSNFDRAINKHGFMLVEFYAPWCGHCKKLAPEYAKAAADLKSGKPAYRIAKVDATASPKVKSRFEISGFPTLKMVRTDDKNVKFEGSRTASDIAKFVRGNAPKGLKLFMLRSQGKARSKLMGHDEL